MSLAATRSSRTSERRAAREISATSKHLASECRGRFREDLNRAVSARRRSRAFHSDLGVQARSVAADGRDRQRLSATAIFDRTVESLERTVDRQVVPAFGVADVVDRGVVVAAPEKRYRVELLAGAEHVAGSHLTLALGHHPVFDANAFTGVRVGPPGHVTGRINAGGARFEVLVDRNAAVHGLSLIHISEPTRLL